MFFSKKLIVANLKSQVSKLIKCQHFVFHAPSKNDIGKAEPKNVSKKSTDLIELIMFKEKDYAPISSAN